MLKRLTISGVIASLLNVIYVVLGGFLWKGYSHLMQPISDLTAKNAPNTNLISILTIIYGICLLVFAISGYIYIKKVNSKWVRKGFFLLICMQVLTLTLSFFPKDLTWFQTSFSGITHIVITAILILFTVAVPMLIGIGLKSKHKYLATYSIISSIIIFVSAAIFVWIYLKHLKYLGLIQRVNIGAFQIWISILSFRLFNSKEEDVITYHLL